MKYSIKFFVTVATGEPILKLEEDVFRFAIGDLVKIKGKNYRIGIIEHNLNQENLSNYIFITLGTL
jgi:hypothetical protein